MALPKILYLKMNRTTSCPIHFQTKFLTSATYYCAAVVVAVLAKVQVKSAW